MLKQITFCFAISFLLFLPSPSLSERLETRFGPIVYERDDHLIEYGRRLRPPHPRIFIFTSPSNEEIVERHEDIFKTVCDKLDIELNGLTTTIRIAVSTEELQEEYRRLVPDSNKDVKAFYSNQDKTIWYALEKLDRKVALHETAHAVLDHYFFRPIPAGVDEFVAEQLERFE